MVKINLKTFLLIIFANSLITLVLPYLSLLISKNLNKKYELGFFNLVALYSLIIVILLIFIYKIFSKNKFEFYGFKEITRKDLKLTLILISFLFPIPLLGRLLDPSFDAWFVSLYNLGSYVAIIYFIINLPIYLIKEELIERSLIQNYLSKNYSSILTILVISINFAILHFILIPNTLYHSVITVISVFLGSLIIASLYELTKNVFLTILTHLIYNFVVFYQIILHNDKNMLGESILFIVWGIFFLFTFTKAIQILKPLFRFKKENLKIADYIFLILFSVVLPIILLLLSKYL